jgi:putative FmdB family regulatory protein
MPIYAYKCESCGHAKDVLQKMSDAPLTDCPACGAPAFKKQLTAAGFQLKGSGWYATDFKGGTTGAPAGDKTSGAAESKSETKSDTKTETQTQTKADPPAASKPADSAVTKTSAP